MFNRKISVSTATHCTKYSDRFKDELKDELQFTVRQYSQKSANQLFEKFSSSHSKLNINLQLLANREPEFRLNSQTQLARIHEMLQLSYAGLKKNLSTLPVNLTEPLNNHNPEYSFVTLFSLLRLAHQFSEQLSLPNINEDELADELELLLQAASCLNKKFTPTEEFDHTHLDIAVSNIESRLTQSSQAFIKKGNGIASCEKTVYLTGVIAIIIFMVMSLAGITVSFELNEKDDPTADSYEMLFYVSIGLLAASAISTAATFIYLGRQKAENIAEKNNDAAYQRLQFCLFAAKQAEKVKEAPVALLPEPF